MATPHVSGIVSLMLSVNSSLTPSQVRSRLRSSARTFPTGTGLDCTTSTCGAGIVDAEAAVEAALADVAADVAVTLTGSSDSVTLNDNLTYTITVSNNGPNTATGVTLTDALPSGLTYVIGRSESGDLHRNHYRDLYGGNHRQRQQCHRDADRACRCCRNLRQYGQCQRRFNRYGFDEQFSNGQYNSQQSGADDHEHQPDQCLAEQRRSSP